VLLPLETLETLDALEMLDSKTRLDSTQFTGPCSLTFFALASAMRQKNHLFDGAILLVSNKGC